MITLNLRSIFFFLPFYLLRFEIFGLPTNVLEILILLLVLSWYASGLGFDGERGRPYWRPILLLFLGVTVSTVFSDGLMISLGILKGWFLAPFIVWFIFIQTVTTREQLKKILLALFWSALGVSFIALLYYLRGSLTYDGRLAAFYRSPNYLAMYLSPLLLLSFALHSFFKKKRVRILLFTAQAFIFFIISLTYSYSAVLAVLGALLFLARRNKSVAVLGLLAILCLFAITQLDSPKLQSLLDLSYPSLTSRLVIWRSALRIGRDHALLGIGPGLFQEHYLAYQRYFAPYPEWAVPQPHNLWLAFWLQTGLLGLFGFVWLVIVFFKEGFKKAAPLQNAVTAAMLCLLLHGLVDTTYWKNDLSLLFWGVIGIGCIAGRLSD